MVLLCQKDPPVRKATEMTSVKIYRVHATQGRIALGDLVEPGTIYTADKDEDGTVVLTPVVIVPRSEAPKE